MIQAAPVAAASTGYPQITLKFRYDYLGRRVEKLVIDSVSNRLISGRRFLYDGWNLIAEYALNASLSTLTLVRSYTWGLDIARTLSEAGGVGALLQIADHPSGKTYFPAYDGNGNIVALVNSSTGTVAAAYEYSPFGEQLRADALDSVVADQPFRFSTKYTDSETGLVYYGRRYYNPSQGRFLGRDPIGEKGGIHLYAFVRNRPVNTVDVMGMLGLDDALVIDADGGGGGYDPVVRMKPFVTAVDSDEKIQRALDAIVANQSISTTIYFNIGGSSTSGKSAEQLRKEAEEKKKKECDELANQMAAMQDIQARNERHFQPGGQYADANEDIVDLIMDGVSMHVNLTSGYMEIWGLRNGPLLSAVDSGSLRFSQNVFLVGSVALDTISLVQNVSAGDEVRTAWSVTNVQSAGVSFAVGAIFWPAGVAVAATQISTNAYKGYQDARNYMAHQQNAANTHMLLQQTSAKFVENDARQAALGCPKK